MPLDPMHHLQQHNDSSNLRSHCIKEALDANPYWNLARDGSLVDSLVCLACEFDFSFEDTSDTCFYTPPHSSAHGKLTTTPSE